MGESNSALRRRVAAFAVTAAATAVLAGVSANAADWPQFRGALRDNVSTETGLLRSWPAGGPKLVWKTAVCQGYAGAAIRDGRVYINDYDYEKKEHVVRCLSLADGAPLWRWSYSLDVRPNHGITRTVPAVGPKLVFSLDPKCRLHALDARTGKLVWEKNLIQEYKATIPGWYAGQNPLLDGDKVVIATGGDALAVAFDQATGKEAWRGENPGADVMSHASLMPATIGAVKQYLYLTMKSVVGIGAGDGRVLWSAPFTTKLAAVPSPVSIGDGRVFVTAGYEAGSAMFQVEHGPTGWSARRLYALQSSEFNSEVHTPVLFEQHLFAVGSKTRGRFMCLSLEGKVVWQSPVAADNPAATRTFELGGFLMADRMFFAVDGRSGALRLFEAGIKGYEELASAQVLGGQEIWGPPALSDGKLLVRDNDQMLCLQVGRAAARR